MAFKCPKCQHENSQGSRYCQECGAQLQTDQPETRILRVPAEDAVIGEIVSERYALLEELGSGGMGVVYKAEQIKPVRRSAALKIIKSGMDTRQVIARFETEREALAVMYNSRDSRDVVRNALNSAAPSFVCSSDYLMPSMSGG